MQFIFIFILLVISFYTEQILYVLFNKWYYQNGITVITFTVKITDDSYRIPTVEKIVLSLLDSERINFKFKEISKGIIAFREAIFQWNFANFYPPIMRGYLIYDLANRKIEVYGLLNWSIPIGAVLLIILFMLIGSFIGIAIGIFIAAFFLFIYTFMFSVQSRRFKELAHIISNIK
jgi:hypothetical protein